MCHPRNGAPNILWAWHFTNRETEAQRGQMLIPIAGKQHGWVVVWVGPVSFTPRLSNSLITKWEAEARGEVACPGDTLHCIRAGREPGM